MTITTVLKRLSAIAAAIAIAGGAILPPNLVLATPPEAESPAKPQTAPPAAKGTNPDPAPRNAPAESPENVQPAEGATTETTPTKDKFDPTRFEKEIAKFTDAEKALPPSPGGIVFTGSSSVRLWNLKESFPGRPVLNRGFGGSIYRDALHYVEQLVLKHEPATVVLYSGDNDLAQGLTPEQVATDAERLVEAIHGKLPETKIVILSIKPSPKRWPIREKQVDANARLAKLAEPRPYVKFVDVWTPMLGPDGQPRPELFKEDKLHMNEDGYAIWAKALEPVF